jgi:hypothetical protein
MYSTTSFTHTSLPSCLFHFLLETSNRGQKTLQASVDEDDAAAAQHGIAADALRAELARALAAIGALDAKRSAVEADASALEAAAQNERTRARAIGDEIAQLAADEDVRTSDAWAHYLWFEAVEELPFVPRPTAASGGEIDAAELSANELAELRRRRLSSVVSAADRAASEPASASSSSSSAGEGVGNVLDSAISILTDSSSAAAASSASLPPVEPFSLLSASAPFDSLRAAALASTGSLARGFPRAAWCWFPRDALLTVFDFVSAFECASAGLSRVCRAWAVVLHVSPFVWRRKQFMYQQKRVCAGRG